MSGKANPSSMSSRSRLSRSNSVSAVVTTSQHPDAANAFNNFQYTAAAQTAWARAGFRAVDPAVANNFRDQYPVPVKLWTIDDLGGWSTADPQLFDKNTGSITKIYQEATG